MPVVFSTFPWATPLDDPSSAGPKKPGSSARILAPSPLRPPPFARAVLYDDRWAFAAQSWRGARRGGTTDGLGAGFPRHKRGEWRRRTRAWVDPGETEAVVAELERLREALPAAQRGGPVKPPSRLRPLKVHPTVAACCVALAGEARAAWSEL